VRLHIPSNHQPSKPILACTAHLPLFQCHSYSLAPYYLPALPCAHHTWNTPTLPLLLASDGIGPKNFEPGRVNFCCSGQVSHVWFGSRFGKFPPKNPKFFNFFPLRIKKISSVRVKKYPGQRRVALLFTIGQKYTLVGLGRVRAHLYSWHHPRFSLTKLMALPNSLHILWMLQLTLKSKCPTPLHTSHL